jgi:phosphoglycolate phosphatase-like HAD superfamily hydrolase
VEAEIEGSYDKTGVKFSAKVNKSPKIFDLAYGKSIIGIMNMKLGFFDIDGTLIRRSRQEGKSLKTRSINHALETVFGLTGIDYMSILGKRIFGMTDVLIIKTTLAELGIGESLYYEREKKLFGVIDEYFEAHRDKTSDNEYVRLPGVSEFLGYLRSRKVRLGLVTGNIRKHADWKMKYAGFDGYFVTGAFGEDAESRQDILSLAMKRNPDIPSRSVCHFGDSPMDLDAARRCGVKAVAICDTGGGTHSRSELEQAEYGLIVNSWNETESIVEYLD